MKKKTLLACGAAALSFCVSNNAMAQAWSASLGNLVSPVNCWVGVGGNPTEKLTVHGDVGIKSNLMFNWNQDNGSRNIYGFTQANSLNLFSDNDPKEGTSIIMHGKLNGTMSNGNPGLIRFITPADPGDPEAVQQGRSDTWDASRKGFDFVTYWGSNFYKTVMNIRKNGKIGMGGIEPIMGGNNMATIKGGINLTSSAPNDDDSWGRGISAGTKKSALTLSSGGYDLTNTDLKGSFININGYDNSNGHGRIELFAYTPSSTITTDGNDNMINFSTIDNSTITTHMAIKANGKVVIGDAIKYNTPNSYKLYVETGILTEKVKVASISGTEWSDYVFADDYKLRDLNEVEDFIKENKHLPEIPSANEVEKDGLDLAKMDAKLLQKVEELTLYVIEQNKRIEAQQKEIKALKSKFN